MTAMKAELTYDKIAFEFFVKNSKGQFYVSKHQVTTLDSIKAIYRNLRENYEYRLRYDEAGKFFIREMELKRIYRNTRLDSKYGLTVKNPFTSRYEDENSSLKNFPPTLIKKNWWPRRNISLTGFYRLASYGEKLRMPAIFGLTVLSLAMLYWLLQSQAFKELSLSIDPTNPLWNTTERSFSVFFQLKNEKLIYFKPKIGINGWEEKLLKY